MQEIQETQVRSLGWEDPMEENMETHSSILAWRMPWTEESGGLESMGLQKSWTQLSTPTHTQARRGHTDIASHGNKAILWPLPWPWFPFSVTDTWLLLVVSERCLT